MTHFKRCKGSVVLCVAALVVAVHGDQIWLAHGVYTPGTALTDTFTLKPGVALCGGLPAGGGDGTFDVRDWEIYVTVLSGDIDGNDITDQGVITDTRSIVGDNAYHVVTGGGVTETAKLDRFAVTAGNADGNSPHHGGSGMFNDNSSPTLTNCILWGNAASTQGPEIHNDADSQPTISYSDIQGSGGSHNWDVALGTDGGQNIDANRLFVAPVDAGNNDAAPAEVTTDLDGNPRIVDGTGDGNEVVDMGAYESQQIAPSLTLTKQGQRLVTTTPEGINCGVDCADEFACGTVVTLTATADPGWTFAAWSGLSRRTPTR